MKKLAAAGLALLLAGCTAASNDSGVAQARSSASPAGASAPAATPTPQPLALMGSFKLSPEHGAWGTEVTATAADLKANTKYDLVWTTVTGSWQLSPDKTEYKGRVYTPAQSTLASVTTDAKGAFQTRFTVPSEFGFQHDVLVVDPSRTINNKSGFDVDLRVSISPTSGPVGTPITIEAKGIGWRQLENSWLASYDNSFTGWLSSVTTKGYAKAVVPATGSPGTHVITVLHGDFTFPYINMQQSPEPDRPMFHLPFTVTDGAAVLPPPQASQSLPAGRAKPVDSGTGVWFDPPEGIVGARSTLKGVGLPKSADVEIAWTSVTGNRVSGSGWEERAKTLAKVKTDANGALDWTFTVPDDLGGAHNVVVNAGGNAVAKTTFSILASAQPLKTDRGPSGTQIMIQLNGVGWTETANIFNITVDNSYAGYACGFNSGGNVQAYLVVSGAPGWHYIDLYPGIYKGVETRPLNFRVPQLTYADDHPAEKLPAFHYAFLVTQ